MTRSLLLSCALVSWIGCAESDPCPPVEPRGLPDAGPDAMEDVGVDGDLDASTDANDADLDAGTDAPIDVPVIDAGSSRLIIHEVQASGDDWIEVKVLGDVPLDVGGLQVTELDGMGMPDVARAATFPDGYVLPAGGYFVILAGMDAAEGLQTDCVLPGVYSCLFAAFGISGGGETLVVVDGSGAIVDRIDYPADVPDEDTSSRVPDGEGDFEISIPTPLAPNRMR